MLINVVKTGIKHTSSPSKNCVIDCIINGETNDKLLNHATSNRPIILETPII